MSDDLVAQFRALIESIDVPANDAITDEAIEIYERGHDVLMMYRGDPNVLVQALRIFVSSGVRPLIYAGAAHLMIIVSHKQGRRWGREGIEFAETLQARAANYSLNSMHVALLGVALMRIREKDTQARAMLDTIREDFPDAEKSMLFILAEMNYWEDRNAIDQVERWAQIGLQHAGNPVRSMTILGSLADMFISMPNGSGYKQALAYYQQVVALNPDDPWAWHNMSIIHREQSNYEKAALCNYRALAIMPFGNAFDVQKFLVERFSKQRHKDPVHEVPRYDAVPPKRNKR
jgi:tetratricopeptide (TPR) repeat protein